MTATRARELGLINAVYPDAAAMRTGVEELAGEIAAKSPLAIAGTKLALNYARDHSVAESLEQMAVLQSAIFSPQEIGASVAAMRSKQTARYGDLSGSVPDAEDPT